MFNTANTASAADIRDRDKEKQAAAKEGPEAVILDLVLPKSYAGHEPRRDAWGRSHR